MRCSDGFDEGRVRKLLVASESELNEAMALIDRHLRRSLCAWVHKRFPRIDADEMDNVWSETLMRVLTTVRAGRFDAVPPLLPWLFRIAYQRAVDNVRRSRCGQKLIATLGLALREPRYSRHGLLCGAEEDREIVDLIDEAIAVLPANEQRVVRVFVEYYPNTRNMAFLCATVGRVSACVETVAAIKVSLLHGRAKVRLFLQEKGYAWHEGQRWRRRVQGGRTWTNPAGGACEAVRSQAEPGNEYHVEYAIS